MIHIHTKPLSITKYHCYIPGRNGHYDRLYESDSETSWPKNCCSPNVRKHLHIYIAIQQIPHYNDVIIGLCEN